MKNRDLGILFIVVGLVFLAVRFFDGISFSGMEILWPLFIIVPGLGMLYGAFSPSEANVKLAVPGAIVLTTGLILGVMNSFGRWEAWAYVWALYPVAAGLAMNFAGQRNADESLRANGRKSALSGVYMLVGFGLFFEVFIYGGRAGLLDNIVFPIVLIAVGAFFILRRDADEDKAKNKTKNGYDYGEEDEVYA